MAARAQREGLFWMTVAVTSYASFSIFTKLLYARSDLLPLDVASWRFLLATPLVWLYLWLRRRPRGKAPLPPRRQLLLLGAIYCMASVLAFFGLRQIPASIYVILFFTYPLMVALLGQFFRDEPAAGRLAGLAGREPGSVARDSRRAWMRCGWKTWCWSG